MIRCVRRAVLMEAVTSGRNRVEPAQIDAQTIDAPTGDDDMNRRDALFTLSAAAALAAAPRFASTAFAEEAKTQAFTLPPLGYGY